MVAIEVHDGVVKVVVRVVVESDDQSDGWNVVVAYVVGVHVWNKECGSVSVPLVGLLP